LEIRKISRKGAKTQRETRKKGEEKENLTQRRKDAKGNKEDKGRRKGKQL
jgi:hypothetical protein